MSDEDPCLNCVERLTGVAGVPCLGCPMNSREDGYATSDEPEMEDQ